MPENDRCGGGTSGYHGATSRSDGVDKFAVSVGPGVLTGEDRDTSFNAWIKEQSQCYLHSTYIRLSTYIKPKVKPESFLLWLL